MNRRSLLALPLLGLLAACQRVPEAGALSPFTSTDVTGAHWGRDFHLIDHRGRPRSLADFRGQAVMMFFGYTHCADFCPTTLAQMARVRARLGADRARLQGLFVTIDPKRDTPQVLAQYVPGFDPSFLGLYGSEQATAATAADFKIFFAAQKPDAQGQYTIDHSGLIYVFDPQGRLRLAMRPDQSVQAMAGDIRVLLQEAS